MQVPVHHITTPGARAKTLATIHQVREKKPEWLVRDGQEHRNKLTGHRKRKQIHREEV